MVFTKSLQPANIQQSTEYRRIASKDVFLNQFCSIFWHRVKRIGNSASLSEYGIKVLIDGTGIISKNLDFIVISRTYHSTTVAREVVNIDSFSESLNYLLLKIAALPH